jgi:TetR/AcrR family transcriptional regulator
MTADRPSSRTRPATGSDATGGTTRRKTTATLDRADSDPFSRGDQRQLKTDAIVAAAARLIHQRGVAGTSLDDVADALGVTKPAVYYYVKNKEELVYLCHTRIAKGQAGAIDDALALEGTGAQKIRAFVERYARFVWAPDSGLPRLWQDNSLGAPKRKEIAKAYFEQSDRLVALIADARRDGSIGDHAPEIVERALVSSILWVPIWYNEKVLGYDQAALLAKLLDVFFTGLTPKQAPRSSRARKPKPLAGQPR